MQEFHFKQFDLAHGGATQKVTTDSVLLGAWVDVPGDIVSVLDVGAGSGLLALMMAQRFPRAKVDAIEIDPECARICRGNFERSPWRSRLSIVEADFTTWDTDRKYDLLISNPPYFNEDTLSPSDSRNVARHEKTLGYETLVARGAGLIKNDGSIAVVCPARHAGRLVAAAAFNGLECVARCDVATVEGRPAALALLRFSRKGPVKTGSLTVRDSNNVYTEEYKELTSDFYKFLH